MSAWSKLPNATHIDAVIASLRATPDKWARAKAGVWSEARDAARVAARGAAYDAVRDAARDAAWNAAWDAAYYAAWDAVRDAAYYALRGVILALVAYDDCAHLLTTNPEHVKMLAGIGDEAAILLYPASLVFSEIKNECLV